MCMVAIVAFGLVGFDRLAVNLLPDITYPTITVRTEFPGVAPAEVERLISEPLEELVGVVGNVIRVSSISRAGLSDVVVEFAWGTNMDFASLDIREKLDLAQLPLEAERPILLRFDPSLDPILRVMLYGGDNLLLLRRLAEERVRLELESQEGVAAVRIAGGLEEEIQVEVETSLLANLGISIDQVTNRLSAENVNLTGGLLKDGEAEFLVRTLNEFQDPEEIAEVIVARIGAAPIRLGDVGRVFRGHKDRDIITRYNGREGVEISIFKEGDANTVVVSDAIKRELESFSEESGALLQGAKMQVVFDQATFIEQAVDEVLNAAVLGGILAIFILYLFLRDLKSTVIIGLSIPISVIATFFAMYASGISLNIMSLGGLALGVGMLVDSSIVVLESIQRYKSQGETPLRAAREGSSVVSKAVVAATLTTICVFVPIVFVEGVAGQLFADQALTVTYSLVASLVVALMLIPMLASLAMDRATNDSPTSAVGVRAPAFVLHLLIWVFRRVGVLLAALMWPLVWLFDRVYKAVAKRYPALLAWALRQRLTVIVGFAAIAVAVFSVASRLGVELIPEMSQGEFLVDLEWSAGTSLEQTAAGVSAIEAELGALPGVASVFARVGSSGESGGDAGEKKEHVAQLHLRLEAGTSRADETRVMAQARDRLRDVPDLTMLFSRPSYFSFRTPIEVEINGNDLQTLRLLATEVVDRVQTIPGLTDVESSAQEGQPEVQVRFDRRRIAELGTTIQAVGELLRNQLQGDVATELNRQDRTIDIRVRSTEEERRNLDDLEQLIVSPASYPVPVPLGAVASIRLVEGPSEIRRLDQERAAVVTANLSGRDLGSVVRDIQAATSDIAIPEGFDIGVAGQNEEMVRSFDSLKFALALAVFLVYLVMASQFESLLHPLVIMLTIPLGLVGSALGLMITGQTISVVVLIGLIMLAGIVVNNAIVLVDYINHLRRVEHLEKFAAVLQAAQVRFRPILMTTTTTVLGLLPMAVGLGEGSEIRAPMAIAVIGGLLVSTVLTLVVIPAVYTVVDRSP
jgi:HAE1 family hydrophobic/amphiphilic exporter-1